MNYGILSVLPPLIAIALAIITKDALLSIVIGVTFGILILVSFNPAVAFSTGMDMIVSTLADDWNMRVVLIVVFLGGLVGLLVKSGGNDSFASWMSKKIKTRFGVQIAAWVMGIAIFFDDYFNCLTIGTVMRPIADAKKVSREKLAYIIDSTSASMCTLTPISSWVAYIIGFIGTSFAALGISDSPLGVYIQSIPYNMYSIFALLLVPIVAFKELDFGPMAEAERRAINSDNLDRYKDSGAIIGEEFDLIEVSTKGGVSDLAIPIFALFFGALALLLHSGGFFDGASLVEAFNEADAGVYLLNAIFLTILFSMFFYSIKGSVTIQESIKAVITGMKAMVAVVIFMTCAWMLGGICEELGTGEYLVGLFSQFNIGVLVPAIVFIVTAVTTFTTGSGWGSIAIMTPIAIPLAANMDANMAATIAAVLSGVVFGDHASPICDTTIISSAGAQCNHIDHCKTQIPYAVTSAICATCGFLVAGFTKNPILPLITGLVIFILAIYILNKIDNSKHNLSLNVEKRG